MHQECLARGLLSCHATILSSLFMSRRCQFDGELEDSLLDQDCGSVKGCAPLTSADYSNVPSALKRASTKPAYQLALLLPAFCLTGVFRADRLGGTTTVPS